jgi:DinB superfamily
VRIESPAFTEREILGSLDEFRDHERQQLADRLEAASTRLGQLVRNIDSPSQGRSASSGEWTAKEVLAHIAVLSKFYGVLTYQVGSGKMTELDLLPQVRDRDVAGEQMSSLPPEQLLAIAQRDHQRTIDYLRSADAAAMQRRAIFWDGLSMSAGEIAQLPLCAHLEMHLDQLGETLRR